MNNPILQRLSSKPAAIVLMILYIVLMAAATIIEKFYGTPVAKAAVYYSPLFLLLQALMVANFILLSVRYRLFNRKHLSYVILHASLIVILGGALTTHLTSSEGLLHIREGERSSQLLKSDGQPAGTLPFEVELVDFRLTRYPGSQSPSSYESYIKLHIDGKVRNEKVFMNNVIDADGYRFFQASYDADEQGTILSVNRDAAGRAITYSGYFLLFAGLLLTLFDPHSRVRRLWKQINRPQVIGLVLLLGCGSLSAEEAEISPTHAERFALLPMQSESGRMMPVGTFASEIVRKFDLTEMLGDMTPEQLLLSMAVYPADWSVIPLVEINDSEIAGMFGWNTGRISYREAFDSQGNYLPAAAVEQIYTKNPAERTRTDKELLKIDDRINILHELFSRRMLRIFPNPADTLSHRWFARGETVKASVKAKADSIADNYFRQVALATQTDNWLNADKALAEIESFQRENSRGDLLNANKLKTEMLYNRLNLPRICQLGYLLAGAFLLLLSIIQGAGLFRQRRNWAIVIFVSGVAIFFLLHTLALSMRWYISGYAPWTNSYETMVFLAWAGVFCGFLFVRRTSLVTALATLFGGIVLFVSSLNWMDPQITPLVPVLKSPWLMLHVASLVIAYGFLGISCMSGTVNLLLSRSSSRQIRQVIKQATTVNELSMLLGLGGLAIGIFLGAVWANESWGRYWSWDPKETWALITMIVYAAVLHFRWFSAKCGERTFNFLSQWAFLSVLMTFLGVNYFLSGMHSYGNHDAFSAIPGWAYLLFILFFIAPAAVGLSGRRKLK